MESYVPKTVRIGKKKQQKSVPNSKLRVSFIQYTHPYSEAMAEENLKWKFVWAWLKVLILVWLFSSSFGGFPLLSFSHILPLPIPFRSACNILPPTASEISACHKTLLKGHHLPSIKTRKVEVQKASRLSEQMRIWESGAHGGGGPSLRFPHTLPYMSLLSGCLGLHSIIKPLGPVSSFSEFCEPL